MSPRTILLAFLLLCLSACEREPDAPAGTALPPAGTAPAGNPRPTDASLSPAANPGTPGGGKLPGATIVIAVLNDQSGIYADFGGRYAVEAAQMAAEEFVSRTGAAVEVISADHQNDPDKAAARAQELFDKSGADVILDVPTSAAALRIMKLAADKRRLYINISAATADLTGKECNRYTFHYAYDIPQLANAAAQWTAQNLGKRWHIIYPKYGFGQEMEAAFRKAIESAGGTVLASDPAPFPHPTGDYTDWLRRTIAYHPDVVGVMQAGADLGAVARAYNALKVRDQRITLVAGLLLETDIQSAGADVLAGTVFATPWYWAMDREARDWADRFQKRTGARPTFAQAATYSAAVQYLEAVRRAGTDQPDAVIKALENYRFSDMFIRNGLIRAEDHLVQHDMLVGQVKPSADVREPRDTVKVLGVVPADRAARPAAESGCTMR
ncbi:MAG: ABC transporter substrate-binding protein [Chloroflexi bacterium]|nr:ABC transporter substrate-binding protein [Chloroflexota bacterium]